MKGKSKLLREGDGMYHVYSRNNIFQKWKPLTLYPKSDPLVFKDFKEFCEKTKINCFDEIILEYSRFSGLERD